MRTSASRSTWSIMPLSWILGIVVIAGLIIAVVIVLRRKKIGRLTAVYLSVRYFMTKGWMIGVVLIIYTLVAGVAGFIGQVRDDKTQEMLDFSDALYNSISLLAIQTGNVSTRDNWWLGSARWTGMIFWASAVLTNVIRLFRESVRRLLVKMLAKDHIIVAGLGVRGVRLVEALRNQGRTVVVIEPNPNHPVVEHCGRMGAVVLFGDADDRQTLLDAQLLHAATILALFPDESDCVDTATAAYRILSPLDKTQRSPAVCCVLRLSEPGSLDVVRTHKIKIEKEGRFDLEILNSHEITATTMVREAMVHSTGGSLEKVFILGLGNRNRLGEMIALRLAKDHFIMNQNESRVPLKIHIVDEDAERWLVSFQDRYPFTKKICEFKVIPLEASKCGSDKVDRGFNAAFVCISDEGQAVDQTVMLRRQVLTRVNELDRLNPDESDAYPPIIVRVRHRDFGYGTLLSEPNSRWGSNIHPVGLEDPLFDADMATSPEKELQAQAIHYLYRLSLGKEYRAASTDARRVEIRRRMPNRPWHELVKFYRDQNRNLANSYDKYLGKYESPDQGQYVRKFSPTWVREEYLPELFQLPEAGLGEIARIEHTRWLKDKQAEGWVYGKVRDEDAKIAENIVVFEDLTEEQKLENLAYVSVIMTRIFALADYWIVPLNGPESNKEDASSRRSPPPRIV